MEQGFTHTDYRSTVMKLQSRNFQHGVNIGMIFGKSNVKQIGFTLLDAAKEFLQAFPALLWII
jgi:hypothetical protein